MACFFSTNGDGLEDLAPRLLLLEFDEVESTGNKVEAVPRLFGMDESWEFCNVSLLRFPLVVAAIVGCDDNNDISLFETVSRTRPIAWIKAAHVGAKDKEINWEINVDNRDR